MAPGDVGGVAHGGEVVHEAWKQAVTLGLLTGFEELGGDDEAGDGSEDEARPVLHVDARADTVDVGDGHVHRVVVELQALGRMRDIVDQLPAHGQVLRTEKIVVLGEGRGLRT